MTERTKDNWAEVGWVFLRAYLPAIAIIVAISASWGALRNSIDNHLESDQHISNGERRAYVSREEWMANQRQHDAAIAAADARQRVILQTLAEIKARMSQ